MIVNILNPSLLITQENNTTQIERFYHFRPFFIFQLTKEEKQIDEKNQKSDQCLTKYQH